MGADPTKLVNALQSKAGSMAEFKVDMSILIVAVEVKGPNFSRMKPEGKAKIDKIVSKYGIQPHKKGLDFSVPTVPRIMNLFAMEIYKYRQANGGGRIIGQVPHGFEPALCFPNGGTCIKVGSPAFGHWLTWYESFCKVVNIKFDKVTASYGHIFSHVPESNRVG